MDSTEKQVKFAERLGRDVRHLTKHDADLVITSEMVKRKKAAREALEKAGLVAGAVILLRGEELEVTGYVDQSPQSTKAPLLKARYLATNKLRQVGLSNTLSLRNSQGEMVETNFWQIWRSFFPSFV